MRRKKILSSLVMLVLILMTLPATVTGTATIKLSDYWFSRGLGDSWTYGYTQPSGVPDFTVAITLVNEGVYSGKYRMGDYRNPDGTTYYNIVAFDNDFLYLYYDSKHNETFDPPAKIPITQELETMVPNPANPNTGLWYFKKLSKLTVPAGTYYDVLLKIDLDRNYGRNSANIYFGLPETIPYGVTHAEWSARHVGTLQDMDFDALTGVQWGTYVLKSTNAKPWGETNGALMLLLMQ
ncbi:MAG: hypothetical protein L6277_09210 [Desulfobacterales bacterium]|nr:hypothetical protein [Pseudomonadota bacterium]MBU4355793.1 hypothetical protein [Pseudomonadota bacterium]MCG2772251.1 hypothetical protein [Desulfobacterales bacterium]